MDYTTCHIGYFENIDYYLRCTKDAVFRQCQTADECTSSGTCSDFGYMRRILANHTYYYSQYGLCLDSGVFNTGQTDRIPYCWHYPPPAPLGCFSIYNQEEDCPYSELDSLGMHWYTWVDVATTEEECVSEAPGWTGCQVPGPSAALYFWNETDCDCKGGERKTAWR
jgi:hypothetical protein